MPAVVSILFCTDTSPYYVLQLSAFQAHCKADPCPHGLFKVKANQYHLKSPENIEISKRKLHKRSFCALISITESLR